MAKRRAAKKTTKKRKTSKRRSRRHTGGGLFKRPVKKLGRFKRKRQTPANPRNRFKRRRSQTEARLRREEQREIAWASTFHHPNWGIID